MPLRRFLPYDILGAGLWARCSVLLGYIFWRSFDRVTKYVERGRSRSARSSRSSSRLYCVVRLRATRRCARKAHAWLRRARGAAGRAPARAARGPGVALVGGRPRRRCAPARFCLAPAHPRRPRARADDAARHRRRRRASCSSGSATLIDGAGRPPIDREAFDIADRLRTGRDVDRRGRSPSSARCPYRAARAGHRRLGALRAGAGSRPWRSSRALALTYAGVHITKDAVDRPRPRGALVDDRRAPGYPVGPRGLRRRARRLRDRALRARHRLGGARARSTVALVLAAVVGAQPRLPARALPHRRPRRRRAGRSRLRACRHRRPDRRPRASQ